MAPSALAADPLLEGLIGPMVQAYYAWRIYVISGTWWVSALVLSCSMMAFGTSFSERSSFYADSG